MPTIAELHTLSEQGQLAWVATANLRDLRLAQLEPLNAGVLIAIQAKVSGLGDARRARLTLAVALLTLAAAIVGAVLAGLALVLGK
jgi:hypothetical protein